MKLMGNKIIFLLYVVTILPTLGVLFLDPTLEPFVVNQYKVSPSTAGVMFALNAFAYVVLCPLGSYLIVKVPNVRLMLFFGVLATGICFIIMGPDL